jgi:hypothetical protein
LDVECFSEAPLKPRCLHFPEAASSPSKHVLRSNPEASNRLLLPLTRAFLCMLGRRARLHLQMEMIRIMNQQLNGSVTHEL